MNVVESVIVGDFGFENVRTTYDLQRVSNGELASLDASAKWQGATNEELATALALAFTGLKERAKDPADVKAEMKLLMHDLSEFPGEIVMEACREWRHTEKFTPTPAELRAKCKKRMRAMTDLRRAIESEQLRRQRETARA